MAVKGDYYDLFCNEEQNSGPSLPSIYQKQSLKKKKKVILFYFIFHIVERLFSLSKEYTHFLREIFLERKDHVRIELITLLISKPIPYSSNFFNESTVFINFLH
jgi:hypothetical protein